MYTTALVKTVKDAYKVVGKWAKGRGRGWLRTGTVSLIICAVVSGIAGYARAESSDTMHTVQWGDTLARIAFRYYGDGKLYGRIAEANRIADPHRIMCGRVLTIPSLIKESLVVPATHQMDGVQSTPALVPGATVQASASLPLPMENSATEFLWRKETGGVFGAGEKLTFTVKWQFVTVGFATMEVRGIETIGDRQTYHIVTVARSAPFFDSFYKVRNTNESWMDVESLCSLKYSSHISENKTKRDETILLDHRNRQFQILESGKTGDIPLWVQDVLSSLYYLRTKKIEVGQEFSIDAHSGDKSWPLQVKVLRLETVNVPAGRFICYVVEPVIREGAGIFEAKGKLQVWLTADEKKVPVLMRSKIAVGSVDAELTEMQFK